MTRWPSMEVEMSTTQTSPAPPETAVAKAEQDAGGKWTLVEGPVQRPVDTAVSGGPKQWEADLARGQKAKRLTHPTYEGLAAIIKKETGNG